jgi:hypothetical protein
MREILGVSTFAKCAPGSVEHHFGISADEVQRMKEPANRAVRYHYPLILHGSSSDSPLIWKRPGITRADCVVWLKKNYDMVAPRSACIGCPFHGNEFWRHLKTTSPEEFKEAVKFDSQIRRANGLDGEAYIHKSLKPLDEADLGEAGNQIDFLDECDGLCGV